MADPLTAEQEMEAVYRLYTGLMLELDSETGMDAEAGLGGKLLYAGEPDEAGRRLLRAANISGTASLSACADAAALRSAMREGAIDFVVTSLDEALRILKNEIRKKKPVAVGISLAPREVLREMLERGVQPDLLGPNLPDGEELAEFRQHGARTVEAQPLPPDRNFNIFPILSDWKQPLAAFDALLLECLPAGDHLNRRWVRLAPRYLGERARRVRSMVCDAAAALKVVASAGQGLPQR